MIPMTEKQLAFTAQLLRVMTAEALSNPDNIIKGKFALGLEWTGTEYILRYTKDDSPTTRQIVDPTRAWTN